ncbi:MAG: hypothetical protein PUD93_04550 [Lachnospiraceae bacterium]|nr:hypothetical protein [Lachnospiraceae bacterium]
MKFIALSASEKINDKKELKEEFTVAQKAGEGRMGERHFFYRYFINVKYISYENIRHAFLREESGECGEFLLKEFYLILRLEGEKECKLRFERQENARIILTFLEENYPDIEIGYKRAR